jgi:hypothetical protein
MASMQAGRDQCARIASLPWPKIDTYKSKSGPQKKFAKNAKKALT